ncbi:MAG: iron ABC transporter permease [Chloroflexota bacterium]|nr:iron ABC transporter permease [Chloroflexota bacterium]MDE2884845.1 iron ABC transporter permease [Chloroflexota bacterium]
MATLPAALRPRGFSLEFKVLVFAAAIITLGFSVIYPIVLLFINSFVTTNPPLPAEYGLDSWRFALSDRGMLIALWNSMVVTFLRQGISFPVAILLAWLIARTNLPGAKLLEFGFWIAFFLPVVSVTQAWILLAHPSAGLLNQTLEYLPFVDEGPLNIYSLWGIIWVHLATNSIAIKVMLLTPAFRNMDAALEDASRLCGASSLGTLRRVTVPVMAPIMMTLLLLSILRAFQSVEIEVLLGLPIRYFVFGSKIFDLVQNEPPDFGAATAMGIIILAAIIPLIIGQYYMTSRRNYTTLSGKYQAQVNDLRKWKWPVFGFVLFLVFLMTIFPMIFLVMGSFMKFSGFFYDVPGGPWTTLHWTRILTDGTFLLSMRNTFVMALGAATLSTLFFTVLAYIIVRMRSRLVPILDFLTWVPYVLPGIVLILAWLWILLGTGGIFHPLYGTIFALILVSGLSGITLGVQIVKSNLRQIGAELEEASSIVGAPWLVTLIRVVVPLLAPAMVVVWVLNFVAAAGTAILPALLASSSSKTLALLQFEQVTSGRLEAGSIVGIFVVLLTVGVAIIARVLGFRVGLGSGTPRN